MLKTRSLQEAEEAQQNGMLLVRIVRLNRDELEYTLIDRYTPSVPQVIDVTITPIPASGTMVPSGTMVFEEAIPEVAPPVVDSPQRRTWHRRVRRGVHDQ